MINVPKLARIEIQIDEPRIARGSVDWRSVQVTIKWREADVEPPIITALAKRPEPVDVTPLKRADGGVELVPRDWRKMRLGINGPTFLELARETPGGLGPAFAIAQACGYATQLIKEYLPDCDSFDSEEQAQFLLDTIERLNKVSRSVESLEMYLRYARPGRKAVPPIKNPKLAAQAVVLKDVHELGTFKIGEKLGIPATNVDIRQEKGENQTVRAMIRGRGRPLIVQCFGTEEWNTRVERMRAERDRWKSMEPKRQFYALLDEKRGTSPEDEERTALNDGFDKTLAEWIHAYEQNEYRRAVRIQLSDARFDALDRI